LSFDVPNLEPGVIAVAIRQHLPRLAGEHIEPLGEGWAFWAFRAGDAVLRFPRDPEFTRTLVVEAAVMRELAPALPLPVSVIEVYEDGPNRLPFTSHRMVPGVPVKELGRPLAAGAGATLGRFLRAMHAFPVERAAALGLANSTSARRHEDRLRFFEEQVQKRVFPLVSGEACAHLAATFEAFLGEPANFEAAAVSHGDIDPVNVLADPVTGELTGVIDWGDIAIGDPAGDFTNILYGGLGDAGLREQLPDLLPAYGITGAELERVRPRCAFGAYCWPLHEIIYCLDSHNDAGLQEAIAFLYKTIAEPETGF
jgi:aminoglycoside 2''-phosphotransferase